MPGLPNIHCLFQGHAALIVTAKPGEGWAPSDAIRLPGTPGQVCFNSDSTLPTVHSCTRGLAGTPMCARHAHCGLLGQGVMTASRGPKTMTSSFSRARLDKLVYFTPAVLSPSTSEPSQSGQCPCSHSTVIIYFRAKLCWGNFAPPTRSLHCPTSPSRARIGEPAPVQL